MTKKKKSKIINLHNKKRGITFAHGSEAEFAKILDFYCIEWQYEPKTFPLRWSQAGQPVECFAPDFYLPEFGLYIEVTTCKARLMTKKKRKIRLINELYPHVKVKLIKNNDFHHLMWKYGVK